MRQIGAADNKRHRLFQDAVIMERREALAKAVYSIKDEVVEMIGMSQRPSFGVMTKSTTYDRQLLSPKSSAVLLELYTSIDEAGDI
jgi:hypothetical protein